MKNSLENSVNQILTEDSIKLVAITGGIGSGKSTVANHFSEMGYPVINTDSLASFLMQNDSNLKKKLIVEFGEEIFSENGKLNSTIMSKMVFSSNELQNSKLEKLNKIVHPVVIDKMMDEIERLSREGYSLIFVESALIYEAALDEGFDYIIVVDAPESKRLKWASARLNLSENEVQKRMKEQISTSVKKNLADFVIENNGEISEMLASADFILELIKLA